jgi:hypothetical protein
LRAAFRSAESASLATEPEAATVVTCEPPSAAASRSRFARAAFA